jgi:flagellar hook-associated protein 2
MGYISPVLLNMASYSRSFTANRLLSHDMNTLSDLRTQETDYSVKLSSYGGLLSNLSIMSDTLARMQKSPSDMMSATVSEKSLLSATALNYATSSNYNIQIENIASTQKISSGIFADPTSPVADLSSVPTQALRIQMGSGSPVDIAVDASNNSLTGIRDAINNTGIGITASVENSGFTVDNSNNTIVFNDGTDRTATLNAGAYTSSGLAAEVKRALEAANGNHDTYTATYDSTANTFAIKNDLTNANAVDFMWEDPGTTAGGLLGFSAANRDPLGVGGTSNGNSSVLGTGYSLVLSGNSTGADNTIKMSVDENNDGTFGITAGNTDMTGLSRLAFDPTYDSTGSVTGGVTSMTQFQAAQDARLKVNGIEHTRPGNSFEDLTPGISLNLQSADTGYAATPTTIKLSTAPMMLTANLNMFVSSYNSTLSYMNTLDSSDSSGDAATRGDGGGPLSNEPDFQDLNSALKTIRQKIYVTNTGLNTLSYIGITFDGNGKMVFDTTRLNNSLSEDAAGVTSIANQMSAWLNKTLTGYTEDALPRDQDNYSTLLSQMQDKEKKLKQTIQLKQSIMSNTLATIDSILAPLPEPGSSGGGGLLDLLSQKIPNNPVKKF